MCSLISEIELLSDEQFSNFDNPINCQENLKQIHELSKSVRNELVELRKENAELKKPPCTCTENSDGYYETTCGGTWMFEYEGITENKAKFCPFCGGEIIEKKYEEEKE